MIFIDSDDYKASGIETMFFPGGEPHAKLPEFTGTVILYLKLRTWNDVGLAACVLDALSRSSYACVYVGLMYFPGARQDKTDGGKYPKTVELISRLFYRSRFEFFVFDPHSNQLDFTTPHVKLDFTNLPIKIKSDVRGIIAPDSGAEARAEAFRAWFYPKVPLILCSKVRNANTGALSNFQMPGLPGEGRYIIVDDICDGGGTFNLLVTAFKQDRLAANCRLELFVSHGIFSNGLENIHPKIEHITTTDSWCNPIQAASSVWNDGIMKGRLTVLPLADLLKQAVKLKLKV